MNTCARCVHCTVVGDSPWSRLVCVEPLLGERVVYTFHTCDKFADYFSSLPRPASSVYAL